MTLLKPKINTLIFIPFSFCLFHLSTGKMDVLVGAVPKLPFA